MEIYYTPEALGDLQAIKSSVVEKFYSVELAEKVVSDITKDVRNLTAFPKMGAELIISTSIKTGYRYLFCRKNYIFYRVENDTIRIVRVLNEKQEFMRILFGITEE